MAENFPGWLQSVGIIFAIFFAVYLMLKQAKELEEMQKRARRRVKRITVVECPSGKTERPYKMGDYVGKKVECGDSAYGFIVAIYAVDESKEKGKKAT